MADEVREIQFDFTANTAELARESEAVALGMDKASGSMSLASSVMGSLKGSAKAAAAEAAAMAVSWVASSVEVATTANKVATNFEDVFGSATALSHEVEELAGHMGLAEHEAQAMLAEIGMLGQSMGMTKKESEEFAATTFQMAGDLARFNPEAGTAADAMADMTAAANGSTKAMAKWGISIKSSEINAKALAMTGKENTSQLTQQDKAMATQILTMEKMGEAQGELNRDIADGSTKYAEASSDIDDMQVAVGQALMPIKKLALEGLLLVAEVLEALEPAIEAVGEVLAALMDIIRPFLPLLTALARLLGGVVSVAVKTLTALLKPLLDMIQKVADAFGKMTSSFSNFKMPNIRIPSFHSGGTVPGAQGNAVPIMAQGGETIGRPGKGGGGGMGGGTVVNITVNAGVTSNPNDVAREIADLLETYTAVNGPVNIKTRDS